MCTVFVKGTTSVELLDILNTIQVNRLISKVSGSAQIFG